MCLLRLCLLLRVSLLFLRIPAAGRSLRRRFHLGLSEYYPQSEIAGLQEWKGLMRSYFNLAESPSSTTSSFQQATSRNATRVKANIVSAASRTLI